MILTYKLLRNKIDIDLQLSMLSNDKKEIEQAIKIYDIHRISIGLAESYTDLYFAQKKIPWSGEITINILDNIILDLNQQNKERRFTADKYPALLNALVYAKDIAIFLSSLN